MCLSHGQVFALDHVITETPPPPTQPALVVTQFSASIGFIELYNQSSEPIKLRDVQLSAITYSAQSDDQQIIDIHLPNAWLLPKQYALFHAQQSDNPNVLPLQSDQNIIHQQVAEIEVVGLNYSYVITGIDVISPTAWMQHKQRGNATLKISPVALADYTIKAGPPISAADPLYTPPSATKGLSIIEVLPNANGCEPNNESMACGDFIKLYNTSEATIDLSDYRIRTDSGGIKANTANTLQLGGELAAGDILTINFKNNGDPLSLTNTGGYVWIEDAHGVVLFEQTIIHYPDASVAAGKGMSWALDIEEGIWKWMTPQPYGQNYWPATVVTNNQAISVSQGCPTGKERNPDTNRCRTIAAAGAALTPCKPGQERSMATNRCRNSTTSSATQKPCSSDQYRSPETGRCRKIQTASSPAPCKPGQERNPLTGRCKKVVKKGSEMAVIEDIESAHKTDNKMFIYAGIGVLAACGYGVYEWRQEIMRKLSVLKRGKGSA